MELDHIEELEGILEHLSTYKTRHLKTSSDRLNELLLPVLQRWREHETKVSGDLTREEKNTRYLEYGARPAVLSLNITSDLNSIYRRVKQAYEDVGRYNLETSDLLHLLELTEMTEEELLQTTRKLQDIQKKRRIAKDYQQMMVPMVELLDKHKPFLKELGKVNIEIKKIEDTLNNRTYTPRALTDIETAFREAEAKKQNN